MNLTLCVLGILAVILAPATFGGSSATSDCMPIPGLCRDVYSDTLVSPSTFDATEFKSRLPSLLNVGLGKKGIVGYEYYMLDFEEEPLTLRASYSFECDSDFVLLEYYISKWYPPIGPFYFGYIKSSDKLYVISRGFGLTPVQAINAMRSENDGAPHLPYLCLAALTVKMIYGKGVVIILNSPEDLDLWFSIADPFPRDSACDPFNVCQPPFLLSTYDYITQVLGLDVVEQEITSNLSTRFAPEDKIGNYDLVDSEYIPFHQPSIRSVGDTITVEFYTYAAGTYLEYARWRAIILTDGTIVSCWYMDHPLNSLLDFIPIHDHGSPYYRDSRKTR